MFNVRILLFISVILLAVFSSVGCVEQNPSLAAVKTSQPKSNLAEEAALATETNEQVEAAKRSIEKSPDAANGYNMLAAGYIHLARETGDFDLNSKAEAAVARALQLEPQNLNAHKFKTSLNLTFHRFAEGRTMAIELLKSNPRDAFLYGALTDANVELGNYPEAVQAVQTMVDLKPDMSSYTRVSYVRSLHGDPPGAIEAMSLAARIADPLDKEAQAWCLVHLGDEYFKIGKYPEAEQQYDSALRVFPNYYFALAGKGRARAASNDLESAAKLLTEANNRVPNVENIIFLGDVETKLGNLEEAQKQYDLAEFIEQKLGNIDRRRLALLWADHDEKLDEALAIAKNEHEQRRDIFTADILAWCLYKKGEFDEAQKAIAEAMRLKTQDARIYYHAGMIENALGNKKQAAADLSKAVKTNPAFDLLQTAKADTTLQNLR